ncbi:MAG: 23S rRNA (adenine(2503)-C(2))-methyltransferase RlmN [Desulfomonilaceae bacterium]
MTDIENQSAQVDDVDLSGLTLEESQSFFQSLGHESYRATQVMRWIHQGLLVSFDNMTNLSKKLRQQLEVSARIGKLSGIKTLKSEDGVKKFLFGLDDGSKIETVYIPSETHDTLCLSTQVGCAMGCRICRTGQMGFVRNLTAGEIVGQLLEVRRQVPNSAITNVVLMGMGEPLANFSNTVRAINIMSNPNGPQISWRRITVSTSGLVPQIIELGKTVRVKLAVSLNAVSNEVRNLVMPINLKYPLEELLAAMRHFSLTKRDRITIEYVLIKGLNDSDSDARRLVKLLNPIRAKVNLIPFNDELFTEFSAPLPKRVASFQDILMSRSLIAIIRKSRGRDILAACGQLASPKGTDC